MFWQLSSHHRCSPPRWLVAKATCPVRKPSKHQRVSSDIACPEYEAPSAPVSVLLARLPNEGRPQRRLMAMCPWVAQPAVAANVACFRGSQLAKPQMMDLAGVSRYGIGTVLRRSPVYEHPASWNPRCRSLMTRHAGGSHPTLMSSLRTRFSPSVLPGSDSPDAVLVAWHRPFQAAATATVRPSPSGAPRRSASCAYTPNYTTSAHNMPVLVPIGFVASQTPPVISSPLSTTQQPKSPPRPLHLPPLRRKLRVDKPRTPVLLWLMRDAPWGASRFLWLRPPCPHRNGVRSSQSRRVRRGCAWLSCERVPGTGQHENNVRSDVALHFSPLSYGGESERGVDTLDKSEGERVGKTTPGVGRSRRQPHIFPEMEHYGTKRDT